MGGTLTPEETPGGGLTMVVSLNAVPAPDQAPAPEPGRRERRAEPAARTRPSRELVLVVDDEPQIVRALAINLRARRYEVHTATTGAEALATAAATRRTS